MKKIDQFAKVLRITPAFQGDDGYEGMARRRRFHRQPLATQDLDATGASLKRPGVSASF